MVVGYVSVVGADYFKVRDERERHQSTGQPRCSRRRSLHHTGSECSRPTGTVLAFAPGFSIVG